MHFWGYLLHGIKDKADVQEKFDKFKDELAHFPGGKAETGCTPTFNGNVLWVNVGFGEVSYKREVFLRENFGPPTYIRRPKILVPNRTVKQFPNFGTGLYVSPTP